MKGDQEESPEKRIYYIVQEMSGFGMWCDLHPFHTSDKQALEHLLEIEAQHNGQFRAIIRIVEDKKITGDDAEKGEERE